MMPGSKRSKVQMKDSGYAWVALFGAFGLCFGEAAYGSSQGLFFVEYLEYFQVSKAETAIISSLFEACLGLSGIILGPVTEKFGTRRVVIIGAILFTTGLFSSSFARSIIILYFSQGLLPGLAAGSFVMGRLMGAMQYFDKRRSLAVAIHGVGGGVSVFVMPMVTEYAIQRYSWRGALMILAGVVLQGAVFGSLLRPILTEDDETTEKQKVNRESEVTCVKKYLDMQLFKDHKLVLHVISMGVIISGDSAINLLIPARIVAIGESKTRAALLVSLAGVSRFVSGIVVGFIGDRIKQYKTLAMALSALTSGCLTSTSYFISSYAGMAAYVIVRSMVISVHGVFLFSVLAELSPPHKLPNTTGIAMVAYGTMSLFAAPMAGGLVDLSKSYAFPFLIFGFISAAGSIFPGVNFILQRREAQKKVKADSVDETLHLDAQTTSGDL